MDRDTLIQKVIELDGSIKATKIREGVRFTMPYEGMEGLLKSGEFALTYNEQDGSISYPQLIDTKNKIALNRINPFLREFFKEFEEDISVEEKIVLYLTTGNLLFTFKKGYID